MFSLNGASVQLPSNSARSRKKQVRRAKAALTAASFVVLPATSAFLAGFGAAHAIGGPGAVGGSVYMDANRNGTQDSGEAGVDGITATAYTTVSGVDTQIGSPTATAGGGLYNINLSNVSAGDAIKVVFTNLGANTAVSIGGSTQTATLATGSSGGSFTGIANLGVAPVSGVTIGDRIWIDTNGNGTQNANEGAVPSQLSNISVDLLEDGVVAATTLTDGNGYYLFVDTAAGVSGPGIMVYAGFTPGKKYAIRVNGVSTTSSALSGYTNTLLNVGAVEDDSDAASCGTVIVTGSAPSATTCDPVSTEINLPAGPYSNTTIDFGFVPYDLEITQVTNTPNVVAGGTASFDVVVTNRGPGPVQSCNIINLLPAGLTYATTPITAASANAGVVGIDPTDASKLRIDCSMPLAVGAQVRFTVNAIVGASVTGTAKNFTYVTPPSTDAAAAETKPLGTPIPTNATDAALTATLNDSQASVTVTVPGGTASLGDKAWIDANNNGVQDAGELGVAGVTVDLLDSSATAIAGKSSTTDSNGMYGFTGLNAGTYSVKFGPLSGYSFTSQNASAGTDSNDSDVNTTSGISDAVSLATGENNLTVDAGFVLVGGTTASVGDSVWIDQNGDGIQNAGEPLYANLTVTLTDTATGTIKTTSTDGTGKYTFFNLAAGSYTVTFAKPAGYTFTSEKSGSDISKDSDADPTTGQTAVITVAAGSQNATIDAGLIAQTSTTVTTATNAATTTLQPASTTIAVPATLPPGSVVIVSTPTSSSVAPASTVAPATTSTTTAVPTSSAAPTTTAKPVVPTSPVAPSPAILEGTCKINSVVWVDTNGNGLVDAGEQVMPGVTVRVTAAGIVKEAVTDSLGRYSFTGVQCGDVTVEITAGLPAGTPLPAPKTIRVLGETAEAPLNVPFGVQLQNDAEVAFGGAESRQFFAAALTFLGMGGLLLNRKRKEANIR